MLTIKLMLPKGVRGKRRRKMLLKYDTDSNINLVADTPPRGWNLWGLDPQTFSNLSLKI